ncbi:hypothetical protein [Algicella marina]|uniref:Uncharacterized protein n=1 Tax=Algicella marina TaxID=2683284 RepID=A0A6P1T658_9RHOB|nr:hypothetical protein [Algicella marina]QHQ37170.1 hypothetical protein GO499_19265 [Algicella marina]
MIATHPFHTVWPDALDPSELKYSNLPPEVFLSLVLIGRYRALRTLTVVILTSSTARLMAFDRDINAILVTGTGITLAPFLFVEFTKKLSDHALGAALGWVAFAIATIAAVGVLLSVWRKASAPERWRQAEACAISLFAPCSFADPLSPPPASG